MPPAPANPLCRVFATMLGVAMSSLCHAGVNYEEDPINYSATEPSNAISRLQACVDKGDVLLKFEGPQSYLRSLLQSLRIPVSSQVLTFGKTSLQAGHISPATPRALYFNDDVHLGYVQGGLIEIAVSDPLLGMAFYTLEQTATEKPQFQRKSNNCLNCHGAARTRNVPGLQIRSIYPDPKGQPVIAAGSLRTDHTSPFEKRWGGWYVTGKHGTQQHLGNFTLTDSKKPVTIENAAGQNVTDLSSRFETANYLTPHSDLVALLVLEHQTDAHNYMTLANFETRHALFVQERQLHEPNANPDEIRTATQSRIEKSAEPLVRYLLFSGEAKMTGPVEGTSDFAREFSARSPQDHQGRSLYHFDLTTRIFKYPCSYLIYSDAFNALPIEMKRHVYSRLRDILTQAEPPVEFAHLLHADRQAILSILRDTKPDFTRYEAVGGSKEQK